MVSQVGDDWGSPISVPYALGFEHAFLIVLVETATKSRSGSASQQLPHAITWRPTKRDTQYLLEIELQRRCCRKWGCNKWGFKGCLSTLPENQLQVALFFCLFRLFPEGQTAHGKSGKRRKRVCSLSYPLICLNPHLLNSHWRHSNRGDAAFVRGVSRLKIIFSPRERGYRTWSFQLKTPTTPYHKILVHRIKIILQ